MLTSLTAEDSCGDFLVCAEGFRRANAPRDRRRPQVQADNNLRPGTDEIWLAGPSNRYRPRFGPAPVARLQRLRKVPCLIARAVHQGRFGKKRLDSPPPLARMQKPLDGPIPLYAHSSLTSGSAEVNGLDYCGETA